jgi:hypothetical protein
LPIYFGVVLGCKGGGVEKKKVPIFFSGAGIRLDIPPCHGLKIYFGMVLGCNGDGGKKEFKSGFVF